MGFINQLLKKRFTFKDFDSMMDAQAGMVGPVTHAGVNIGEETALKSSAVYACVRLLAWSVGSLPFHVYRRAERGKEKNYDHPLYRLLHDEPNPEMTSFTYRSTLMSHITLWGNGYSEITKNRNGVPVALWPIPPWRVEVRRTKAGGLFYRVKLQGGKKKDIPRNRMFHLLGLSTSGDIGLSVVGAARESIGLSLAAEEFGARLFGEGTNVGGIASHPGSLSETAHRNLRESLKDKYSGLGKAHKIMLLEEGMQFEKIGIPPEDAQFLQSRKFQIAEIARIYNVPLHLIQEHENSTTWGSGIEQLNIGFVIHSLRPYLVNWEQEVKRKLFPEDDENFAEFSVEGLLRGDSQTRADLYTRLFQTGAITPNEIREFENKNPYSGGDEFYVQLNMVPVKEALTEQEVEEIEETSIQERAKKIKQVKNKRSARSRSRIARSYERTFGDASLRVIRREEADIMREARKIFEENNSSELSYFHGFLDEFYEDHPPYVRSQMLSVFLSLAQGIHDEAAVEVGREEGMDEQVEEFVEKYQEAFNERHIASSKGQLYYVSRAAIEDNREPLEDLQQRFDEWKERRPQKIGLRETVQLSNAVAKATYAVAGIEYLRWVGIGSETCEYCEEMDGKVVGINQNFLDQGQRLDAEDREDDIVIYRPIGHPQLHQGCVCQVMPE